MKTSSTSSLSHLDLCVTRRTWIQGGLSWAAAGAWWGNTLTSAWAQSSEDSKGPFEVEPLPYPANALEPSIDARTMLLHHNKHYAGYVRKLNRAVISTPSLAGQSLETLLGNLPNLPASVRTTIRNNGGGAINHALFWKMMSPEKKQKPQPALAQALKKTFGSFSQFQEEFSGAAASVFGSGWAWLSLDSSQKLIIEKTANQNSPLMQGRQPLLGLDVWEHAYYLKYQNKRPAYIQAWWDVVNWRFVSQRYEKLMG